VTSVDRDRSWAIFTARTILGVVFFVAGLHKVFNWGPLEHARRLFVVPYADTFLPAWSLWATGTAVPLLELVTGGLVLIGLWTRPALFVLGAILVLVSFGHLLVQPSTSINPYILPRSALLLIVLVMPAHLDRFSIDGLLARRSGR
jgi:thiosulfate dehydrogenase [quinone] large subunit